jgi:7 transmembrane receptor (rhodopsin family)
MFILGTIGNMMNIIVFCCLKEYRSLVTSTFLAAAAFARQLYLVFSLGFKSLPKWIGYDIASRNSSICKSMLYLKNVSIQVYLTCLCFSYIDRYLMASRSVRQRQFMTQKRALLMICVGLVVWMCASIPRALLTIHFTPFNICGESPDFIATATYLN